MGPAGEHNGPNICLFAQYDSAGALPPHTRAYLSHLAACGFRLHVACSGLDTLPTETAAFLRTVGATGHARPNRGLDFGAWSDLLRAGCAQGAKDVLLANDSVFGPFGDLRPILGRMREKKLDAWGMVESHERVWHLQSWFVCATAAALARPAVQRVFAQDFSNMGKEEIILHGELGLGVAFRAEALRTASVWGTPAGLRRLIPVNPSHFDWRGMLTTGKIPFIKTELLRDNPANLSWLSDWPTVITALPGGDPAAIRAALATRVAGRSRPAKLHRLVLNALLTHDRAAALRSLPVAMRRPRM